MSITPDDVNTADVLKFYVVWFIVALAVVVIAMRKNAKRKE